MTVSVSPWWVSESPSRPALAGGHQVDAVVIGGGIAGLSTALALRRSGLSVVVLERRFCGYGASGRNAGHLTPTIGKDIPTLLRVFGEQRTRDLVRLADEAVGCVEELLQAEGIDCEYDAVGNIVAAVHERQFRALDRAADAAQRLGLPWELLERNEMRRRGIPPAFVRGLFEPHGGVLHPGKYVAGLAAAAERAGVQVFEGSPVLRLQSRPGSVLARAEGGTVRAAVGVVATNAWTRALGLLRGAVLPVWVQLFRTEPLSAAQREAVGWPGREGIYTAHEMLESYRLTRDGRIVGGAKTVLYRYGGRFAESGFEPRIAGLLERTCRQRFPELDGVTIERHWGGPIAFALDFLPVVGRTGREGRIGYAVSFAGHGIALATWAGRVVADLLLEREAPGRALWGRFRIPLPPEPLRWLLVRALVGAFGLSDRRTDAALQ